MNESEFIYSLTANQRQTYNGIKVTRNKNVIDELDRALTTLARIRTIRDQNDDNLFSSEEPLLTDTTIYINNALYHSRYKSIGTSV